MTRPASPPARGWFITIEGPEGAGKTTQAARLETWLRDAGVASIRTREPGGTKLGEQLRDLLLRAPTGVAQIDPLADALLFNAARRQLVAEVIRPALDSGVSVVCARFADSTLAYQGYGSGLDLETLRSLEAVATDGLRPDLTILLDLPVEVGLARKPKQSTRPDSKPLSMWPSTAEFATASCPLRQRRPGGSRSSMPRRRGRRSGRP